MGIYWGGEAGRGSKDWGTGTEMWEKAAVLDRTGVTSYLLLGELLDQHLLSHSPLISYIPSSSFAAPQHPPPPLISIHIHLAHSLFLIQATHTTTLDKASALQDLMSVPTAPTTPTPKLDSLRELGLNDFGSWCALDPSFTRSFTDRFPSLANTVLRPGLPLSLPQAYALSHSQTARWTLLLGTFSEVQKPSLTSFAT